MKTIDTLMLKKIFLWFTFIVIFLISATFAAFNVDPVKINFYFFMAQLPLSAVIIIAIIFGMLLGAIALSYSTLKLRYKNKRLQHKLMVSEQELNSLRILPIKEEL